MAFPITNYSRVWVRGKIVDLARAVRESTAYGATGPVQFIPSPDYLRDVDTGQIIDCTPLVVYPSATDGSVAIQLPATDDPQISPSGWNYKVVLPTGTDMYIQVPISTGTLNSPGDPLNGSPVIELAGIVPEAAANGGSVQVLAGADGRGISSMDINGSNHLIITYDDAGTSDAGLVPTAGLDAEAVRDLMGTALQGGSGITVTPNDAGDTISVASSITQYTDALARAAGSRVVALTDGATITPNANTTDIGKVTLGGNRNFAAPSGTLVAGQKLILRVKQDGSGSRVPTWNAVYRFPGGTTPTLTSTANKTDYLGFIYNSDDSKLDCVAVRLNL